MDTIVLRSWKGRPGATVRRVPPGAESRGSEVIRLRLCESPTSSKIPLLAMVITITIIIIYSGRPTN